MTGGAGRRLLVSAFAVHAGGGKVLLRQLLRDAAPHLKHVSLDARAMDLAPAAEGANVDLVPPSMIARVRSLLSMPARGCEGDVLLGFNSLPPLRRSRARTVVFVHTPYLVIRDGRVRYPALVRVRQAVERALFRLGASNADEFWVQTPTVARDLAPYAGGKPVRIVPLVHDGIATEPRSATAEMPAGRREFLYPADGVAHKNHRTLLLAWALLRREHPHLDLHLTLTLPDAVYQGLAAATGDAGVTNAGPIAHAEVLARLRGGAALIFPSTIETFGLPLLEAAAEGAPILAAERDFVRDVCIPSETFDPQSPTSIAAAVLRLVGAPRPPVRPVDGREFVRLLLA